MDRHEDCNIGCQEVTIKNKRGKKSQSKIFRRLLHCLFCGFYKHMLNFKNSEKTEFEVKLVDKKNKKKWSDLDIDLFKDLDSLSPKPRKEETFEEDTKNRFKSNMTKLEKSGCLQYLGTRKVSKCESFREYRILKFPNGVEEEARRLRQNPISSQVSPVESKQFNNATSHYSCLSGEPSEVLPERNGSCFGSENSYDIITGVGHSIPNNTNISYKSLERTSVAPDVNQNAAVILNVTIVNQNTAGRNQNGAVLINPNVAEVNQNEAVLNPYMCEIYENKRKLSLVGGASKRIKQDVSPYNIANNTNISYKSFESTSVAPDVNQNATVFLNVTIVNQNTAGRNQNGAVVINPNVAEVNQNEAVLNPYMCKIYENHSDEYEGSYEQNASVNQMGSIASWNINQDLTTLPLNECEERNELYVSNNGVISPGLQTTKMDYRDSSAEEYNGYYGQNVSVNQMEDTTLLNIKEDLTKSFAGEYNDYYGQNASVNQMEDTTLLNIKEDLTKSFAGEYNGYYGQNASVNQMEDTTLLNIKEDLTKPPLNECEERDESNNGVISPGLPNTNMDIPDFSFMDATLFEETEAYNNNLKDTTDPLLSSAALPEEGSALSQDYDWQTDFKYFSRDENVSDDL